MKRETKKKGLNLYHFLPSQPPPPPSSDAAELAEPSRSLRSDLDVDDCCGEPLPLLLPPFSPPASGEDEGEGTIGGREEEAMAPGSKGAAPPLTDDGARE